MDGSEWWRTFSGDEAPEWVRQLREQHQAVLEREAVSQSHDTGDITNEVGDIANAFGARSADSCSAPSGAGPPHDEQNPGQGDRSTPDTATDSPSSVGFPSTEQNPEQGDGLALNTVRTERIQLYRQFLARTFPDDPDYQTQIGALLAAFQYDISARLVAEVVGCSIGYARRFEYHPETGVREKTWAQKQRASRVGPALRQRVLDRDASACVRCGATTELVVHHIIPARQGGAPHMGNLATLCEECHRAAHDGLINSGEVFYESIDAFWRWADASED